MDEIDLDPCTSPKHHERSQANKAYYENGLKENWREATSLFVNPPGSKRGVQPWWSKFVAEARIGIWLGFNLNQLAYLTPNPFLYSDWIFIPKKRISFVGAGDSPPHNNYFAGRGCSGYAFQLRYPSVGTLIWPNKASCRSYEESNE